MFRLPLIAIALLYCASANANSDQIEKSILELQRGAIKKQINEDQAEAARIKYHAELSRATEIYITAAYNEMKNSGIQFDGLEKHLEHEDSLSKEVGTGGVQIARRIDGNKLVVINHAWGLAKAFALSPTGLNGILRVDYQLLNGEIPLTIDGKVGESCTILIISESYRGRFNENIGDCNGYILQVSRKKAIAAVKKVIVSALNPE